jgi:hypothetical protein
MAVTELKFTLSLEEANIILTGLGELPAKTSMPVIAKLQTQAAQQMVVDAAPPKTAEKIAPSASEKVVEEQCLDCGAVIVGHHACALEPGMPDSEEKL